MRLENLNCQSKEKILRKILNVNINKAYFQEMRKKRKRDPGSHKHAVQH